MKILITGAGGFIGSKLALKLAESGEQVRAMVHSKKSNFLLHPNIEIVKGDVLDKKSLEIAMFGCEQVYHLAAMAKIWAKNPQLFYDINVEGCENVIQIGAKMGVKKFVVTSSAGTIGPTTNGNAVTENQKRETEFHDHYEISKLKSEEKIIQHVKNGTHIVIVNPTRSFGPGEFTAGNTISKIISRYVNGKWKFKLLSGNEIGNYVFVDDVAIGHILAMKYGRAGGRYILGGENATFNQFISIVSEESGIHSELIKIPLWLITSFAKYSELMSKFGVEPKVTSAWVKKYRANWTTSIAKAEQELGYKPRILRQGIKETIDWIKSEKK